MSRLPSPADDQFAPTYARERRPPARRQSPAGSSHPAARRFSIVVVLYLVLATAVAAGATHVLHLRSPLAGLTNGSFFSPTAARPKYLVLLVLDGARPDYFGLTSLPHVDALRASGTQYTNAIDGILEAETPAGHATIATGSRPTGNGILGFDWANDNDRISLFSPDQMSALIGIMHESHAPTIAGLFKKRYPGSRVVALSGHKYYAAAPLGGPDADAILYYQGDPKGHYVPVSVPGHSPPASVLSSPDLIYPSTKVPDGGEDHLATKLALRVVQKMQPQVLMINYPEFDWPLGHVYGGNLSPSAVMTDMKIFDSDLGSIEDAYRKAGILDQTLFVITADHGMMPVTRFVPASTINNAVTQAGTTAPDVASGTAAFVWLSDATKAQAVANNIIAAHDPGIQSVYYLATTGGPPHYLPASATVSPAEEAANQYLLGALLDGHEPHVVIFGNEGISFSDPGTHWKADHGGNSWESQHVPLILSGPGVQPGQVLTAPAQLDDIAPTVLTDMGVTPAGMQGHVLTDALDNPASADQKTRAAEITQMQPVVGAVSAQDASPPKG